MLSPILLAGNLADEQTIDRTNRAVDYIFSHYTRELPPAEVRYREDWAYELAVLMRNRFLVHEVYEEWFEHRMSRAEWREFITGAPGMKPR